MPEGLSALLSLAHTEYLLGAWDDAVSHAQIAASLSQDAGQDWILVWALTSVVPPLAGRGSPAAVDYLRQAQEAFRTHAGGRAAALHMASARIAHANADHMSVAASLRWFAARQSCDPLEPALLPWRPLYAEALARTGRSDDAEAVIAPAEQAASDRGNRTALLAATRARAAVETARGRPVAADAAYRGAAELAADLPLPFERGLLELDHGSFLRRAGRRSAAVTVLEAARDRFAVLGAAPYLARCERELATCGHVVPRMRPAGTTESLTPQEVTVARFAGNGLSNREIATEMVLSVRTIEYHLTNVYAKLGLRSRAQLAATLHTG